MGKYVERVASSKRRKLWGSVCVRITSIFSFPTHTRAHFAPQITKDYKMFSMWLQNKDKTETQNALCNFLKSPHMCKLPIIWLGALCGLCILPHIHGLRSALVGVVGQAVYVFLACMGVECVRA